MGTNRHILDKPSAMNSCIVQKVKYGHIQTHGHILTKANLLQNQTNGTWFHICTYRHMLGKTFKKIRSEFTKCSHGNTLAHNDTWHFKGKPVTKAELCIKKWAHRYTWTHTDKCSSNHKSLSGKSSTHNYYSSIHMKTHGYILAHGFSKAIIINTEVAVYQANGHMSAHRHIQTHA